MSEIDTYGEPFPLDETLCGKCVYRLSRIMIPLDLESYGIDDECLSKLEIDADDEDNEILVEQHICLILQRDLDGIVTDCNFFKNTKENSFFTSDPWKM
jgi:hypothetical protein